MLQIEQNKELAASFQGMKYCAENHNYTRRFATNNLLNIPRTKPTEYTVSQLQ